MGKINGGSGRRARGEYDPNEVSKTLKELANGAKLGEGRVDRWGIKGELDLIKICCIYVWNSQKHYIGTKEMGN